MSLAVGGDAYVRIAWDGQPGASAAIIRKSGGESAEFGTSGTSYLDRPGGGRTLDYEVVAGGKSFKGQIAVPAPIECSAFGGGSGDGPPANGPPECDWITESPGQTPYNICFMAQMLPFAPRESDLAWRDSGQRAGYLVEFGTGGAMCQNQPPFSYSGQIVAATATRKVRIGANPGIPGVTDSPALGVLLDVAGLAPKPWPNVIAGTTVGWKVRPVGRSADGRSLAVGQPHILPRLFRAQ